jgi:hypothetical protein
VDEEAGVEVTDTMLDGTSTTSLSSSKDILGLMSGASRASLGNVIVGASRPLAVHAAGMAREPAVVVEFAGVAAVPSCIPIPACAFAGVEGGSVGASIEPPEIDEAPFQSTFETFLTIS